MTNKKDEKTLIDTAFLADLFDLTERRIQQLSTEPDPVLTTIKKGKNNYYDLIPAIKKYIAYLKDLINGKSAKQEHLTKEGARLDAEIRYKNTKAETAELQLKELSGQMHRSEDVEAVVSELVFAIRGMLVSIPNRCSADLADMEDANEISQLLSEEINQVLEQLSLFQYDPQVYKKRIQERNKMQEMLSDDE